MELSMVLNLFKMSLELSEHIQDYYHTALT